MKLWTEGPFFRHERPQAGRYRQFTQVDAEAIGSDSPARRRGADPAGRRHPRASSGSRASGCASAASGSPGARAAYLDELRAYLRSHEGELSDEVRGRIDANPLRAFDADHEGTRKVMADAPTLLDRLDADGRRALRARSARCSTRNGVSYEIDPTLVRGLDYYTRTLFEFECERLGAQSGIGGGGRYDGLIEQLGGPPTPGCGWALGVDRIALALEQRRRRGRAPSSETGSSSSPRTAIASAPWRWSRSFAAPGSRPISISPAARIKGQMKQADRVGARYALILAGDGEGEAARHELRRGAGGRSRDAG